MKIHIMSASASDPTVGYEWKPKPIPAEVRAMLAVCSEDDQCYSAVIYCRKADDYSVLLHNMELCPKQTDYMERALKCHYLVCGLSESEARMLVCKSVENHKEVAAMLGSKAIIKVAADHFSVDESAAEEAIGKLLRGHDKLGREPLVHGKYFGEESPCSVSWKKALEVLKTHQLRELIGIRVVFSELGNRAEEGLDLSLEVAECDFEKTEGRSFPSGGGGCPALPLMVPKNVMIGGGIFALALIIIFHSSPGAPKTPPPPPAAPVNQPETDKKPTQSAVNPNERSRQKENRTENVEQLNPGEDSKTPPTTEAEKKEMMKKEAGNPVMSQSLTR